MSHAAHVHSNCEVPMLRAVAARRTLPNGVILLPFALLLVVTSPALAQTSFAVGTIVASPATIQSGGTVTVTAAITDSGSGLSGLNVLLYVTDPSGQPFNGNFQVARGQSFAAGQTRTYTFQWTAPSGVEPGTYSASVGAFSGDWSTPYAFETAPSAVTITSGSAPTFAIGRTRASPDSVPPGEPVTVTTQVIDTGAQPASDIIVLCELNNAADDANIASLV